MAPTFTDPVPAETPISRGYVPPDHLGVDFACPVGTLVHASAAGTVTQANDEYDGFGNVIVVGHVDNYRSLYAHLSEIMVIAGAEVGAGEVIGRSGGAKGAPGAGNSKGPHLHFQIMDGPGTNSTNTVDPLPLLGARPVEVDVKLLQSPNEIGLLGGDGRFTSLGQEQVDAYIAAGVAPPTAVDQHTLDVLKTVHV